VSGVIKSYPTTDTGVGDHEHVTGTNVAGNKRALDTYVRNPDTDPVQVSLASAELATPTVYNVTCPLANNEYSRALSADTKEFMIKVRQVASLKLAFVNGDSGTTYISVPANSSFTQSRLLATGLTLYFQSPVAGIDVEILEWT